MLLHEFLLTAMANGGVLSGTFSSVPSFAEITNHFDSQGTSAFKINLHYKDDDMVFFVPSQRRTIESHHEGQIMVPRKKLYLPESNVSTRDRSMELVWVPAEQPIYLGFEIKLFFEEDRQGKYCLKIRIPYRFSVWKNQTLAAVKPRILKRFRGF